MTRQASLRGDLSRTERPSYRRSRAAVRRASAEPRGTLRAPRAHRAALLRDRRCAEIAPQARADLPLASAALAHRDHATPRRRRLRFLSPLLHPHPLHGGVRSASLVPRPSAGDNIADTLRFDPSEPARAVQPCTQAPCGSHKAERGRRPRGVTRSACRGCRCRASCGRCRASSDARGSGRRRRSDAGRRCGSGAARSPRCNGASGRSRRP